jgi:CoA:oxalate CoA-transferase
MPAPLAGKCILDLGALCRQRPHALAVSMATKLCVDYGARVVRIVPAAGDPLAAAAPLLPDGGSALDVFLNRGKESAAGAASYDAVIGDAGSLAEYAGAASVQVRLSVFGAGEDPDVSELALAALAGLLDIVGDANGPPTRLAGHQLPYAAGLSACTGLLAALHAGAPDIVDVSLFDVACWLNWKAAAGMLVFGTNLQRGNARNHWAIVPAQDGHIALVYQEKDWPALVDMISDARLDDPQFASSASRATHRAALMDLLRPWFAVRSRADITRAAQGRRIPIGPVLWPTELLNDAQFQARAFLRPGGQPALPIVWDGQRILPEVAHGN